MWYCVHLVFGFMPTRCLSLDPHQHSLEEELVLFEAADLAELKKNADRYAATVVASSDTLTIDGEPGTIVYIGIRRAVSVAMEGQGRNIESGSEATYLSYTLGKSTTLETWMKTSCGEVIFED